MTDTIFGPSISTHDVTLALRSHLQAWMPTELERFARKYGYDNGAELPSYTRRRSFTNWPGDLTPLVILVCPGTVDETVTQDGDGNLSGAFRVEVAVLVESTDEEDVLELASCYWEAIREAIVQHASLSGFSERVEFKGEDTDNVLRDTDSERTLGASSGRFWVYVRNFANRFAGPSEPLVDPAEIPDDFPTADTTDLEVTKS